MTVSLGPKSGYIRTRQFSNYSIRPFSRLQLFQLDQKCNQIEKIYWGHLRSLKATTQVLTNFQRYQMGSATLLVKSHKMLKALKATDKYPRRKIEYTWEKNGI